MQRSRAIPWKNFNAEVLTVSADNEGEFKFVLVKEEHKFFIPANVHSSKEDDAFSSAFF